MGIYAMAIVYAILSLHEGIPSQLAWTLAIGAVVLTLAAVSIDSRRAKK